MRRNDPAPELLPRLHLDLHDPYVTRLLHGADDDHYYLRSAQTGPRNRQGKETRDSLNLLAFEHPLTHHHHVLFLSSTAAAISAPRVCSS